ncbi:unnamed protein product [Ceratitis capitata]|uniref:(Mediterranean fruit fly) hypothetical protein n=1 Tax=Ceratitis capitata TaxID=7213 RepID=A0A811V8E0_CERCA|nr:unnamed protein product [Ceratitis capitata]
MLNVNTHPHTRAETPAGAVVRQVSRDETERLSVAKLISTTRLLTLQLAANQGANHPDYQKTIQPTRQPGSQSASQPAIQQSSQHVTHKTLHSCKHQRKVSFPSLHAKSDSLQFNRFANR